MRILLVLTLHFLIHIQVLAQSNLDEVPVNATRLSPSTPKSTVPGDSKFVVISVTGLPDEYRVYNWNYTNNEAEFSNRQTTDYSNFNFTIPIEFVEIGKNGKINLWNTLNNWREKTPRGVGYPRTNPSDRVTRYPFTEDYDPSNPKKLPNSENVIALGEALKNQKKIPNLSIKSSDGKEVNTVIPITSLEKSLNALAGKTVSCTSNSKKAAECLVCNCANEAMGEDRKGRININRTVLRRVTGVDYPNTICGVVWQKSQFSWTIYSGKKFPYMSFKTLKGENLKECIEASKEAIVLGPWQYDSFYNPKIASPSWRKWKGITHMNHRFVQNPKFRVRDDSKKLLEATIKGEAQGVE